MCVEVKNCCCCFKLRTGVIIIGVLDIIAFTLILVQDAVKIHFMQESAITGESYGLEITSLIITLLRIVVSCVLIHGARKEKPQLFTPWLWFNYLATVLLTLCVIYTVYLLIIAPSSYTVPIGMFLVLLIASIRLSLYFISVVRSYRKELTSAAITTSI